MSSKRDARRKKMGEENEPVNLTLFEKIYIGGIAATMTIGILVILYMLVTKQAGVWF